MSSEKLFDEGMEDARIRLLEMDALDGSPDQGGLLTIALALEAGLRNPETGAQFDALVMLFNLLRRIAREQSDE